MRPAQPTPTRRAIIASTLLAAPALRAAARGGTVVIVGAGSAGLAAAAALRAAGQSFTLVEARDRIGGRAYTDRALGVDCPFDAGAEYIHWAEHNPWAPIARAAKARFAREDGWARTLTIDGRPATDAERRRPGALAFPASTRCWSRRGAIRRWPRPPGPVARMPSWQPRA
ncbi:MAG: FAD-dependent oxidoreductase [Hyphomicrobiales bacterium]